MKHVRFQLMMTSLVYFLTGFMAREVIRDIGWINSLVFAVGLWMCWWAHQFDCSRLKDWMEP